MFTFERVAVLGAVDLAFWRWELYYGCLWQYGFEKYGMMIDKITFIFRRREC